MSTVVPFKARGIRAALREGMESRIPMRFQRERIHPGVIHGFVIGLSRDFCLIAEIGDALRFDGYLAVAITDLSLVESDPAAEFVLKALALRGEQLTVPEGFGLEDWVGIARSAAACAPLLSINMVEDDEGEISYVGQLADVEADALVLREIDPNASWYPDTGAYEFEAIGSIGFGSGYLEALWQVAGTPADPLSPRAPASDSLH
ncbi:hypothetical protein [Dokdonella koreensis]|uniref:Uncharacterized protein n=1 Tax=Dokdonella koreensis DS-123 TaxID=1300342 RepID=A0A167GIX7_9GAMM|nr:hypothetical protein [Dokdonella koreensis]ANB16607.1 Hypothetical protein I596_570 [Dokdonella koreensis DS-123]